MQKNNIVSGMGQVSNNTLMIPDYPKTHQLCVGHRQVRHLAPAHGQGVYGAVGLPRVQPQHIGAPGVQLLALRVEHNASATNKTNKN